MSQIQALKSTVEYLRQENFKLEYKLLDEKQINEIKEKQISTLQGHISTLKYHIQLLNDMYGVESSEPPHFSSSLTVVK